MLFVYTIRVLFNPQNILRLPLQKIKTNIMEKIQHTHTHSKRATTMVMFYGKYNANKIKINLTENEKESSSLLLFTLHTFHQQTLGNNSHKKRAYRLVKMISIGWNTLFHSIHHNLLYINLNTICNILSFVKCRHTHRGTHH